jgi:hypothetical protein
MLLNVYGAIFFSGGELSPYCFVLDESVECASLFGS